MLVGVGMIGAVLERQKGITCLKIEDLDSQKIKDSVFEKMFEEYDNDGININYFRKKLEWENVSISEYERHFKITNGV